MKNTKRFLLALMAAGLLGGALALSGANLLPQALRFALEERNPVTHLRLDQDGEEFRFAIVSDRTGGHRAGVFSQAMRKIKLLQPEFVLSIGDLIEGGNKKKPEQIQAEWQELDGFVRDPDVPFFYVPGNHDIYDAETAKIWQDRYGRAYYHFLYRNVLFLILNTEDPPGKSGNLGAEQIAYARKVLDDNRDVRWTVVAMHQPLWTANNGAGNGWGAIEQALEGRRYTVFVGHIHQYRKFVRNGQNYYQLATTGGVSLLRGVEQGEFDHVVWVTMKKDGPVLANLLLDAIHKEDLDRIVTDEPVETNRKPTFPVRGRAFYQGSPIPGAQVVLTPAGKESKGSRAVGIVAADGSFAVSTYTANDGAVAGDYAITVVWKQPAYRPRDKSGPNLLPIRYATVATSGLQTTIKSAANEVILELTK